MRNDSPYIQADKSFKKVTGADPGFSERGFGQTSAYIM